jgi:transmembrane sensor
MTIDPTLREQAVHWAVLTGDPQFDDWDGFTAWLEADPAHALAYDQVSAAVADVADVAEASQAAQAAEPQPAAEPAAEPANDNPDLPPGQYRLPRRAWLGGAIAASLAIVAAIGLLRQGSGSVYTTAPGELEVIALDDGSTVTLAGNTRLVLRGDDRREAQLEHGQALFDLRFKGGRPFEVAAGEDTMRDIGTVFEVRRLNKATAVTVAEGAVLFDPAGRRITVNPGEGLTRRDGSDRIERARLPGTAVGEWREGRQSFRDATLGDVAAMLSAATGQRFTVASNAAEMRVSGSVMLDPIRRDPASLGPLLGVTARAEGESWVLEP